MTLPKRRRLSARELSRVLRGRPSASDELFSLRTGPDHGDRFRCAVVVPSAVAKLPTTRNRLRRRVADAIRRMIDADAPLPPAQCLLMLRTRTLPSPEEIRRHVLVLLKKSAIVSS